MSTRPTSSSAGAATDQKSIPAHETVELGPSQSSATNVFTKAETPNVGPSAKPHSATELTSNNTDFVATYLARWMSPRNKRNRVYYNPIAYRKRLKRRKEILDQGRRSVL